MHLIGMLFYSPFLFSTVQLCEQSYWWVLGDVPAVMPMERRKPTEVGVLIL